MSEISTESDFAAALASVALFADLTTEQAARVFKYGSQRAVAAGSTLFDEGDESDALYIVLGGRLDLFHVDKSGDRCRVGSVGPGEAVGELGAITRGARTATARARRATTVFALDSAATERVARKFPSVGWSLARRAAFVATSALGVARSAPPLTLLVGEPTLTRTVAGAIDELAGDRARVIDESTLARRFPNDSEAAIRELEDATRQGEYVFVIAEPGSQALVTVVDRVVVTIRDEPIDASSLIVALTDERERRGLVVEVVIVHEGAGASVTAALPIPECDTAMRMRLGVRRDRRRVVRSLTGQSRAIVFGGGGARAFAQFGVLRALEEHGHEFDLVLGTGMGALVGVQFALGWTPDEMQHRTARALRLAGRWPSVPSVAVFDGAILRRGLRHLFGSARLEDTWIPSRVCATDLSAAQPVWSDRGEIVEWLEVATAVPGMHPPGTSDGHLLADGSLLEPLPVNAACDAGAVHTTAIDTIPRRAQLIDATYHHAPGGLTWFAQLLPVAGAGFPGVFAIVERGLSVGQHARQIEERSKADVLITPPVDRYGALDFGKVGALAELGYLEAARVLEREIDVR